MHCTIIMIFLPLI